MFYVRLQPRENFYSLVVVKPLKEDTIMMKRAFAYLYVLCLSNILVHFRFLSVKLSRATF